MNWEVWSELLSAPLSLRTFFFYKNLWPRAQWFTVWVSDCSQISVRPPLRLQSEWRIFFFTIIVKSGIFQFTIRILPPPNKPKVREKLYVWFFIFFVGHDINFNSRSDKLTDFLTVCVSSQFSRESELVSSCELWLLTVCTWVWDTLIIISYDSIISATTHITFHKIR